MYPKVSICIPTYQQPDLLYKALQSISIQNYKDFEVIITDDSLDNRIEQVVMSRKWDFALTYSHNKERKGSPENWNVAINRAQGEFIKILHHDDRFIDANSLAGFVSMLEKSPDVDFAFCSSFNWNDTDLEKRKIYTPTNYQLLKLSQEPRFLFRGNIIGAPSATIFKKSIKERFDGNLKWLVDVEFYIRILTQNPRFIFSETPYVFVTNGSNTQLTSTLEHDKRIQIYEWLYLDNKIFSSNELFFPRMRRFLCLFRDFGIKTKTDLSELGVNFTLPFWVNGLLVLMKFIR